MKNIQAIFAESGHGKSNKIPWLNDPGAVRNVKLTATTDVTIKEHDLAKEIAIMVVSILKNKPELATAIVTGVGTSPDGANISDKVKYVKSVVVNNKLDPSRCIGVAIHFNTGGGKGTEAFYQSKNKDGAIVAKYIVDAVDKYTGFGFHGKSVKPDTEDRLKRLYISDYVVGNKFLNFILLEVCYLDYPSQIRYVLDNKQRIAESIANGILTYIRA